MSTRCQIGFYKSATQPLEYPDVILYRHSDGYPDKDYGVLAALVPWATDFHERRGLDDTEYASARALVALIRQHDDLDGTLSYGICNTHHSKLHGDIEYYYRVDPSAVSVYVPSRSFYKEPIFAYLRKADHINLSAERTGP